MRRLIISIAAMLLLVSLAQAELSEYPEIYFEDWSFIGKIVVGEEAPVSDITAAINILPALNKHTSDRIRGSILDEDVDDFMYEKHGLISIGTECDNEITRRIMGLSGCENHFKPGEGMIYFYKSALGKPRIVVAGGTPADTNKATIVLGNPDNYDLVGRAIRVTGNADPYTLEYLPSPTDPQPEPEVVNTQTVEENVVEEEVEEEEVEEYEEVDFDNKADEIQEELDEELAIIEERRQQEEELDEEEPEPDYSDEPFLKRTWLKFKSWIGWFFR